MTVASRVRSWLPLLPLLGILAMTYWLDQQAQPEAEKADSSKQHTPDAIVDNLKAVTLNQQGTPRFIMAAKQLVHYSDDDSTTLAEPDITALTPMRPDVHITARHGTLSSKGDVIELNDDVKIVRAASQKQSELVVQTDYAKVIPDMETIQTHRAVTVTDANNRVDAIGMEMDNRTQTIKLLSQVKASNAVTQN
jgi:lipopolysaccharide export system protein LptC